MLPEFCGNFLFISDCHIIPALVSLLPLLNIKIKTHFMQISSTFMNRLNRCLVSGKLNVSPFVWYGYWQHCKKLTKTSFNPVLSQSVPKTRKKKFKINILLIISILKNFPLFKSYHSRVCGFVLEPLHLFRLWKILTKKIEDSLRYVFVHIPSPTNSVTSIRPLTLEPIKYSQSGSKTCTM